MTDSLKTLIEQWRKEADTYKKQEEQLRAALPAMNGHDELAAPWRFNSGMADRLRYCASEIEKLLKEVKEA